MNSVKETTISYKKSLSLYLSNTYKLLLKIAATIKTNKNNNLQSLFNAKTQVTRMKEFLVICGGRLGTTGAKAVSSH
ncbi:MAG TPA: hypothetical protein VF050_02070 [Moraxellaceae bacterium]